MVRPTASRERTRNRSPVSRCVAHASSIHGMQRSSRCLTEPSASTAARVRRRGMELVPGRGKFGGILARRKCLTAREYTAGCRESSHVGHPAEGICPRHSLVAARAAAEPQDSPARRLVALPSTVITGRRRDHVLDAWAYERRRVHLEVAAPTARPAGVRSCCGLRLAPVVGVIDDRNDQQRQNGRDEQAKD